MTPAERQKARRQDCALAFAALPYVLDLPPALLAWTVRPREREGPEPWTPDGQKDERPPSSPVGAPESRVFGETSVR